MRRPWPLMGCCSMEKNPDAFFSININYWAKEQRKLVQFLAKKNYFLFSKEVILLCVSHPASCTIMKLGLFPRAGETFVYFPFLISRVRTRGGIFPLNPFSKRCFLFNNRYNLIPEDTRKFLTY
jgi:hypothetical protein